MVNRVPADIADIVYSGTRSRIRPQMWNLPEAQHFRVHKIGAGDLGIRLQLARNPDFTQIPDQHLLQHIEFALNRKRGDRREVHIVFFDFFSRLHRQ